VLANAASLNNLGKHKLLLRRCARAAGVGLVLLGLSGVLLQLRAAPRRRAGPLIESRLPGSGLILERKTYYLVVRSSSLVISMAGLMDAATGQLPSYTSTTRSMVSRSFSSAVRWRVCLIRFSTSTLFSVSTSPTVSAERLSSSKET
jgi:hypothetical protein